MRSKQLLQPVVLNQPGVVLIILLVLLLLSFPKKVNATTTTKKLTKKKMKKGVFYPWFGNVMLLLFSMMAVVESYSQLPNGNGCPYDGFEGCSRKNTDNTLNSIVDRWLDTGTRSAVETDYGQIGDWNVSSVTNFKYLFEGETTFNADISKWNVAAAENMERSECSPLKIIVFGSVVLFFLFSGSMYSFFAKHFNFLTVLFFAILFRLRSS